jgi:hypothetical protein
MTVALAFSPPRSNAAPVEFDVTAGCYLTDEAGLYRTFGRTADEREQLVCVEDCASLEILLIPLDTVLALRLVTPAASS